MDEYKNFPRPCPISTLTRRAEPAITYLSQKAKPAIYNLETINPLADKEFRRPCNEMKVSEHAPKEQSKPPENCVTNKNGIISSDIIKGSHQEDITGLSDTCNYFPVLTAHIIFLNRQGEPDDDKDEIFTMKILDSCTGSVLCREISLRRSELKRASTIIGDKVAGAMLYPDAKNAGKIVENTIRSQVSGAPVTYRFTQAGWNVFRGRHFYACQGYRYAGVEIDTPYTLPAYSVHPGELFEIVEKALRLYGNIDISRVLFLFALSGVLYAPFREAGYPIRFLLFVIGKTGSFKTSLTKVLYVQLCKEEYRDTLRQIGLDTEVSMERTLAKEGTDTVNPFDDYNQAKTSSAERIMKDNLESLIRMTGDGSTRSRSNKALENLRGEGVQGTVVLTGELMGTGLSSNLRCLYCNIERSMVNREILTEFQQKKYSICTLIRHFADFLSGQWEPTVEYIRSHYELHRNDPLILESITNKRLVDSYVTLLIISEVCMAFLRDYCQISYVEVERLFDGMKSSLLSVIRLSEAATEDTDPAFEFMKAFAGLMETGQFKIKQGRLEEQELRVFDGFCDDKYVYVLEMNFYEKTDRWLNMAKLSSQMSLREVEKLLHKEGYLVASPNGPNKVTFCCRVKVGKLGNKINFVKLRQEKLQLVQQGKNPNSCR